MTNSKKTYQKHKVDKIQINVRLPQGILDLVDEAAKKDFTTRSDIIRMAILWYLRPQGRDLDRTDPELILKTLKHRQVRAAYRQMFKDETDTDWYDG